GLLQWRLPASTDRHGQDHLLPVRTAGHRGSRPRAVARRAGQAGLRQHRQVGMGRVARPPDHADQREPPLAARPGSPRLPRGRDAEVPVRRRRRQARRLRAAGRRRLIRIRSTAGMGTGAPAAGGFDVVVVGGGAAGVLVALRLATGGGPPPRVAIVEPGARLGEGAAYSTTQPVHLLNVPAARMSAFEERPGHFVDFLAGRSRVPHARLGAEFAPRALFAQYLRATLEALPAAAAPAHLRASATDLERDGAGWRVHLSSGAALPARAVVLATGNAPRRIPPFLLHPGARVVEAWDYEAVAAIPDGADTCILGTGLSMVDAALVLGRPGRRGHLMALSRRGLAPLAHAPGGPPAAGDVDDLLALGVRARMRLLRRRAAAGDEPWQWTMDRLRPHGQALWRSLDPAEQRRFLRHAVRWWDIHRHRIAPDVAARIARLRAEGRLELVAGRLRAVTPHPQ